MRGAQQARDWTRFLMRLIAMGIGLGWLFMSGFAVADRIFIERYGRSAIAVLMVAIPLGVLIGWRWEGIGGAVVIIGAIVEAIVVYYGYVTRGDGDPLGERFGTLLFVIPPFLIVGLLLLASWWRLKRAGIPQNR